MQCALKILATVASLVFAIMVLPLQAQSNSCDNWTTAEFIQNKSADDILNCFKFGVEPDNSIVGISANEETSSVAFGNWIDYYGRTPLHYAAKFGAPSITVDEIIMKITDFAEQGSPDQLLSGAYSKTFVADIINWEDQMGLTPLQLAAAGGNADYLAFETFIDHGAKVNLADEYGLTPLHFFIAGYASADGVNDSDKIIDMLFQNEAELRRTVDGFTPLHVAARYNADISVIQRLIDEYKREGKNPNSADNIGWTPLHWAAAGSANLDLLATLMRVDGANLYAVDRYGRTPLDIALLNNNYPIFREYLKSTDGFER